MSEKESVTDKDMNPANLLRSNDFVTTQFTNIYWGPFIRCYHCYLRLKDALEGCMVYLGK